MTEPNRHAEMGMSTDLLETPPAREVARIPLDIELARGQRGHFQLTSTSQLTSTLLPLPSWRCIG